MNLAYELQSLTTYDGVVYPLADGASRFVLTTPGNMGLPPIEYLTERGYKTDGSTLIGYRVDDRVFGVSFRQNGCSRNDYWRIREALINICRPNRGGGITYTIRLSNGEMRSIVGSATTPVYPETEPERWDEYSVQEILQFICHDPIFFEPAETEYLVENNPSPELTFPIAFDDDNIYFGTSDYGIASITYEGNWYSYPVIIITAPFESVSFTHLGTGANITLTTGLSSGYLIINLVDKTIVDDQGNDLWGYLTVNSDIYRMRIEPDPVVAGGVNEISFFLAGYSTDTQITISYNNRYVGI